MVWTRAPSCNKHKQGSEGFKARQQFKLTVTPQGYLKSAQEEAQKNISILWTRETAVKTYQFSNKQINIVVFRERCTHCSHSSNLCCLHKSQGKYLKAAPSELCDPVMGQCHSPGSGPASVSRIKLKGPLCGLSWGFLSRVTSSLYFHKAFLNQRNTNT